MTDEENDTSASETDALLADLERRSSEGGASTSTSDSGDDEDLEAFLASLEDGDIDTPAAESKSSGPDPLAAEFAELEKTAPPEPEAAVEKPKDTSKKSDKEKKKVKAVEKGESDGLKKVAAVIRWSFYIVPTLVAVWVLGAALSNWVSAAWLVLLVSFTAIFGLAAALRLGVKKGSYGIWLGSLATLVSVGLLAGATAWSGASMAKFGHWPTSAVAEAAGWPADHGAVAANAWIGEVIGGQLSTLSNAEPAQAYRLGGQMLLSGESPDAAATATEGDEDAKTSADEAQPEAAEGEKPDAAEKATTPSDESEKPTNESPSKTPKTEEGSEAPAAEVSEEQKGESSEPEPQPAAEKEKKAKQVEAEKPAKEDEGATAE